MTNSHISTDCLERYHLRQLREPELGIVEEHLLWCHECLNRMEATELFIDLVRSVVVRAGIDWEITQKQ